MVVSSVLSRSIAASPTKQERLLSSKCSNGIQVQSKSNRPPQQQGFIVRNEAIPGPLFMSDDGRRDGDFLKGLSGPGSFIKFPVRYEMNNISENRTDSRVLARGAKG